MAPLPPFEQSYSFRLNVNKGSRATSEIIAVRIMDNALFPSGTNIPCTKYALFAEAYFVQGK